MALGRPRHSASDCDILVRYCKNLRFWGRPIWDWNKLEIAITRKYNFGSDIEATETHADWSQLFEYVSHTLRRERLLPLP